MPEDNEAMKDNSTIKVYKMDHHTDTLIGTLDNWREIHNTGFRLQGKVCHTTFQTWTRVPKAMLEGFSATAQSINTPEKNILHIDFRSVTMKSYKKMGCMHNDQVGLAL